MKDLCVREWEGEQNGSAWDLREVQIRKGEGVGELEKVTEETGRR